MYFSKDADAIPTFEFPGNHLKLVNNLSAALKGHYQFLKFLADLNMRSKERGVAQNLYKLLQLSFCNLNLVYSFLDDKQLPNLCLNISHNGELTTLQGFKLSLTFSSVALPLRIPLFKSHQLIFSSMGGPGARPIKMC